MMASYVFTQIANMNHRDSGVDAFRRVLNDKNAVRRALAIILAIHTGLLAYSGSVHSPTLNACQPPRERRWPTNPLLVNYRAPSAGQSLIPKASADG